MKKLLQQLSKTNIGQELFDHCNRLGKNPANCELHHLSATNKFRVFADMLWLIYSPQLYFYYSLESKLNWSQKVLFQKYFCGCLIFEKNLLEFIGLRKRLSRILIWQIFAGLAMLRQYENYTYSIGEVCTKLNICRT